MEKDQPLSLEELKNIVGGARAVMHATTTDDHLQRALSEMAALDRMQEPLDQIMKTLANEAEEAHSQLKPSQKSTTFSPEPSKSMATA